MKHITTKADFIKYCKRQLGFPVVQINVSDEQISDRIDEALGLMQEYHPDATQKTYVKYQITQQDMDNRYLDMNRASGTADIESGSVNVIGHGTSFPEDTQLEDTLIKINGETKEVISVSNTTFLTVNSAFSSTATNQLITFPNTYRFYNVIKIFPIGDSIASGSYMWDLNYQIRLNELYDFTTTSYIPYEVTMQHLRTIQMLFVGDSEIRFNRRNNRLYLDINWQGSIKLSVGTWMVIEAYRILTPDMMPELWDDWWLKRYAVALIKKQWGYNTKKYKNIALIGGVTMSGQELYDEAVKEVEELEDQLRDNLQPPPQFFVG
jgi:hypothetical protein